ncbi:hypothetical protein CBR_g3470 [Chara braunii]|uniref:Uncharacterized protein n=1 Tax=Chara braunii TaxID=69332 RepID=A0A388JR26_CHABU|nr:hypothetical protein CBR_g3470 [Chara braunii]|eukprot:GBG60227.1 hypothetical protein CBR_g3470 [Chara braunii]
MKCMECGTQFLNQEFWPSQTLMQEGLICGVSTVEGISAVSLSLAEVEIAYVVGSLSVCPPLVARRCAAGAVVVVTPVVGRNTVVDVIAGAGDPKVVVAASFCLGAAGAGIALAVLVAAGEVGPHILSFVGCVVDVAVAGPVSAFVVAGVAGATVVAAGSPDVGFVAIVHDAAAVPPEAVAAVAGDALAAVRTAGALVQLGPGGGAPGWAYNGYREGTPTRSSHVVVVVVVRMGIALARFA